MERTRPIQGLANQRTACYYLLCIDAHFAIYLIFSLWDRIFGLVVRKQLNADAGHVCYLFAEVPAPLPAAGAVTTLDVSLFARFIQRYLLLQTN